MKKLNNLAASMILSETMNISIDEAREKMYAMSFKDYLNIMEASVDITPPSGQTISPTTSSVAQTGPTQQPNSSSTNIKSIWPGKGAPVEVGMTVGLKGPNGLPVPGQVSQVDTGSKGAKIKNPTTGQTEWVNLDTLQPYTTAGGSTQNNNPGQPQGQIPTTEAPELTRLRELAGIKENCSAGATGAGTIASAPAAMGSMKRRQPTDEQVKTEYTPKEAAKTIAGDTKPNQASGKLSADLSARGRKTASRINNGFKK